ncbi:MAG: hypothetical protein KDD40_01840 [Bdellovibrionales bacterium]|nr:hypothetical protein [Bdellovibrionales bacterium]
MQKIFKLVKVLGFCICALSAHAAEVKTSVEASGKGSYFYEEHHPTKFDFSTFTFCGGKNSDAESDSDQ